MPPRQPQTSSQAIPLTYARNINRLYCRGIDLNDPVDSFKDEFHYPILENLRSYMDGVIQPRQGLTLIAAATGTAGQTPVHSIRRLNNPLNSTYTRLLGAGTRLSVGQTTFAPVQYNASDVIFSGKPLSMVPWRPDQSPVSWMYVADSSAMYKVSYDGSTVSTHKIGIAPPISAPTVELDIPIAIGNGLPITLGGIFGSAASWVNAGIAGAFTATNRFTGVAITAVLYDSGTDGWACVVPASMANMGQGTTLKITDGFNTYYSMLWELYRSGSSSNNAVDRIIYDNDPTNIGTCTISPVGSSPEIRRNAVVRLNGGTNYFRITEVFTGPDGTNISFRCSTGATTIAAGHSLAIVDSFRSYIPGTVSTAYTLQSDTLQSTFTPAAPNLIGTITYTPGSPIDLTAFVTGSSQSIADSDYFHISYKCADLSQIVQLRVMFDVDDGSFTKNFYYRAVTPSDLVAAAQATQTALAARTTQVQNNIVDNIIAPTGIAVSGGVGDSKFRVPTVVNAESIEPLSSFYNYWGNGSADNPDNTTGLGTDGPREQTGTGNSQWSEIRFRRGDCVRAGTDQSKGWKAVQKIRLEISMVDGGAAGVQEFSSLTFFGGGAPDVGDVGGPYIYRYRYRVPTTGVVSNWSPATKAGVLPYRNNVVITCSAPISSPEVTLADVQRAGGNVAIWADVGSVPSPYIFTDKMDDELAFSIIPDSVGDVNYQPWVCSQMPKSGTTSLVAGSIIKDSGTNFSFTNPWLKGTGIKVNGVYTTIRRVMSTSLLELEDCIGAGGTLTWEIPEPFIQQPLPCLWGPVGGWFFACGDVTNPGRLYYSNINNPDSTGGYGTQGASWVDVTSPSEPLQNGFVYNGRNYVFSSERLYEIVEIAQGVFIPRETPTGKGLMYRWSFCVGPRIWFLSKDGIYETDGGIARSITFDHLAPLFPREGQLGVVVNGFNPPNMVTGNLTVSGITADASTFFKLSYYDNYIYFVYPDTSNVMRCLTYQLGNFSFLATGTPQAGWFPDIYNPTGTNTGIFTIYGEEGAGVHNLLMGGAETSLAKLYSYSGTTDNGTAIPWHFRQASFDAGDKRSDKLWADFVVSADPGSVGLINVAAGINNYTSTVAINNPATGAATIDGTALTKATFDIVSGAGVEARNLAVDLSGIGTSARLYYIEPAFAPRPEDSFKRAPQYDDSGYEGEKWVQGIEIEADTQNIARSIDIRYDNNTSAGTLIIQHNGRLMKPYSFSSAFVAHMMRLTPVDSSLWKLYRWKWIWEPEPPLVTVWDSQQTSHGHVGFIHLKAVWFTHTSTADLTLTITRMDDNTSKIFNITNSAGVRGKETYILLGPADFCKGKTFKYKITQASNIPFRVYQRHCGVLVKPWGSAQAFTRWVGWGGDSGDGVAQI